MSVNLTDYSELLESLQPESMSLLENTPGMMRSERFPPRGIDNYLKGASALQGLGRGRTLADAWINEIPLVAKEVGDAVISDLATTCLMLASKTSGAVIEMIMATLATAQTDWVPGFIS